MRTHARRMLFMVGTLPFHDHLLPRVFYHSIRWAAAGGRSRELNPCAVHGDATDLRKSVEVQPHVIKPGSICPFGSRKDEFFPRAVERHRPPEIFPILVPERAAVILIKHERRAHLP